MVKGYRKGIASCMALSLALGSPLSASALVAAQPGRAFAEAETVAAGEHDDAGESAPPEAPVLEGETEPAIADTETPPSENAEAGDPAGEPAAAEPEASAPLAEQAPAAEEEADADSSDAEASTASAPMPEDGSAADVPTAAEPSPRVVAQSADAAAPTLTRCESNFGYDFKMTFEGSEWLSRISSVTVNGIAYARASSSYDVWNNTSFYADTSAGALYVGEAFGGTEGTCVISAEGFSDLTLLLNTNGHTATVVTGGSPDVEAPDSGDGDGDEAQDPVEATITPVVRSGYDFVVDFEGADDFLSTVSGVLWNGTALEETDSVVTGSRYKVYTESTFFDARGIHFANASYTPFQSGDILTVLSTKYGDVRFKVIITGSTFTVEPADENTEQGDTRQLHIRLVGSFEPAVEGQVGYDAITGASTNVSVNKNSNVEVQAAFTADAETEPAEEDWLPLADSTVAVSGADCSVNLDAASGMTALYSPFDSSLTLSGTPARAGAYPVSVTVTDEQGRTATSNELVFRVYTGHEHLSDQLILENCTQTADGKYMYDMEPWTMHSFAPAGEEQVVIVPADVKAWYGSHESGTYGYLGEVVPDGAAPTQTLVVPAGCNLTIVNMEINSGVRIVVEDGGTVSLRDSVVNGIVDVQAGGTFSMNYNAYGGETGFLSGASMSGQIVLRDGATLTDSLIYSHTNYLPNGDEARSNARPVVVAEGNVKVSGQVYIRGDEAASGLDPVTGAPSLGQGGLLVSNGTLVLEEGAVLGVYAGGATNLTTTGGAAVQLDHGSIVGAGTLVALGGEGWFGAGGAAVSGMGTIQVDQVYLHGGNSLFSTAGTGGAAVGAGVSIGGGTVLVVDGQSTLESAYGDDGYGESIYWSSVVAPPNLDALLEAVRNQGTALPDLTPSPEPDSPETPEGPGAPSDPNPPAEPDEPATPESPDNPTTPDEPEDAEDPEQPGDGEGADAPGGTGGEENPTTPSTGGNVGASGNSGRPSAPQVPTAGGTGSAAAGGTAPTVRLPQLSPAAVPSPSGNTPGTIAAALAGERSTQRLFATDSRTAASSPAASVAGTADERTTASGTRAATTPQAADAAAGTEASRSRIDDDATALASAPGEESSPHGLWQWPLAAAALAAAAGGAVIALLRRRRPEDETQQPSRR